MRISMFSSLRFAFDYNFISKCRTTRHLHAQQKLLNGLFAGGGTCTGMQALGALEFLIYTSLGRREGEGGEGWNLSTKPRLSNLPSCST